MSNSQGDTKFFSVRIVSIDYYMAPPIPDIDIAYSSVQGESVKEVPVIRVYGSTPAGQKACIHIHRALPYLYIPCSDIPLQSNLEGNAFESAVARAVEKALKLKGNAGSKRQHVHGCTVVRAKKFYGYHSSEELFLKIYLYYPHDVSRAANLLLGGAVFEKSLQPYESHIPFLLQFLVDYNLYGMGHMHLAKMKFRHPVLDNFPTHVVHISPVGCRSSESQADATICPSSSSLVWKASTIPAEWMWPFPVEPGCSSDHVIGTVKRQSTCELEGDTSVDDILNQQCKIYTSLSQTRSDVKMVQSLIPIWEEEYERSGVHEEEILHDPGKPLPQDVLRTHLNGAEYDHKLTEICGKAQSSLLVTSEEDVACILPSQHVIEDESVVGIRPQIAGEQVLRSSEARSIIQMMVSQDSAYCGEEVGGMDAPHPIEELESKVADPEGVALLKWLASSQAAEELNSDDELQRDVILTPLLPASTIGKVLEKANVEFENESQKECQDILDSMEDLLDSDDQKGKASFICQDKPPRALADIIIPQSDGAGDEQPLTSAADSSDIRMDRKLGISKCHTLPRGSSSFDNKRKRERLQWGSLPFPQIQQIRDDIFSHSGILNESDKCSNLAKGDRPVHSAAICEVHKCSGPSPETIDHCGCSLIESRTSLPCSVRDLMRKKRCIRDESSNRGRIEAEEGSRKEKNAFVPKRLEFHMEKLEDPDIQLSEVSASGCIQLEKERDLCEIREPVSACSPRSTAQQEFVDPPIIHEGKELDSRSYSNRSSWLADKSCLKTSDSNDIFVDAKLRQSVASCSSGYSSCEEKGNICFEDESVVKCGNTSGICRTLLPEVVPQHMVETGCSAALGFDKLGIVEHCASRVLELESTYDCMKEKGASGYISMTFHKKPPLVDWRNIPVSNHPSFEDGSNDEETSAQDEDREVALPFFLGHDEEESKQTYRCDGFPRDSSIGIPMYYQNDGSCAYLLTPAISPPSTDSVLKWLAFKDKAYASETAFPESSHGSLEPVKNQLDQESSRNVHIKVGPVSEGPASGQIEGSPIGAKEVTKLSQDISQISGPSGQSKNTPISQIGFRDPASIGAGQQLTLLSIEVQAESRGDLRPDPQHDAINIIVLGFQNDNNSSVDIHVLLRGAMEACGRNLDGVSGCNVLVFPQERQLLEQFIQTLRSVDPDILMGWDVQGSSLGFLAERAALLGVSLLNKISRTPSETKTVERDSDDLKKGITDGVSNDSLVSDTINDSTVIEDEWGRTHASGVHVGGRIVLNVWRLMRGEVKLNMYTVEAVAEAVLRRKIPSVHWKILNKWFSSGPVRARFRCIDYLVERAKLNLEIVNQLDMINRTSELARVFGIDFFSVLSRGSQYRVESMLVRLAHTQNYVLISPGHQQVASQPAMECLPLVMEPESGFYSDPVVVLDFQSLYPSMIIAYNLCFSTCLGSVVPSKLDTLGVSSYTPEIHILRDVNQQLLVTPNGVMYVSSKVRKGVLPRLLEEILSTRIMVKKAMKKLTPSQQILHRIFNARQLALKLIANVTYGYTAAGFSGRMPCAELADSIVQCGRRTLEHAISVVNTHNLWDARVVYGDTDSMFVLLKGRTVEDAFHIGSEIASTITALNPNPVTLKMEKVYHSCFLLTKKRYVGYSYESLNQPKPIFDAKGIETVRRDTCGAVAKMMEKSLKTYFESQDISKVRAYLQRQWSRILSGRVSLQDFIFAKEVRLGTYSTRSSSSLPPAAIVASKAMRADPRAEPRYAERVPYVVVHGEPGARLVDMVVDPQELLAIDSPYRLNDVYYITKQIIPALQRVFGLVGADLSQWFQGMPRPIRDTPTKHQFNAANAVRARIDFYYSSRHCVLCGELFHASNHICDKCAVKGPVTAAAMAGKTSKLEREIQHLVAICRHCGGGDWIVEGGVKCTSLACSVYYERRKVQKELQAFSAFATEAGFYPKCMVEWF